MLLLFDHLFDVVLQKFWYLEVIVSMSSEANRNVLDEEEDEGEGTLVAVSLSTINMTTDADNKTNLQQKGILKNRSFAKTPCFRESYLYGISGGLLTGITYFMFTSKYIAAVADKQSMKPF